MCYVTLTHGHECVMLQLLFYMRRSSGSSSGARCRRERARGDTEKPAGGGGGNDRTVFKLNAISSCGDKGGDAAMAVC